jgi:hypothetical protein
LITLSECQPSGDIHGKKIRISATLTIMCVGLLCALWVDWTDRIFPLRLQCLIADFFLSISRARSKKSRGAQTPREWKVEGRRGLSMPYNGSLRLIIFIVPGDVDAGISHQKSIDGRRER